MAGFIFIGALSTGSDLVMMRVFPEAFTPDGASFDRTVLVIMTLYVAVFAIAGCYLTARLAPSHPMRHALILGALGLVLKIGASTAMWDTAPAWFHILGLVLVMPYAWIGGWLRERQVRGDVEGVRGGMTSRVRAN